MNGKMKLENVKCVACGKKLGERVSFNNCRIKKTFPLIKRGESIHLECYIELIIQKFLEREKL